MQIFIIKDYMDFINEELDKIKLMFRLIAESTELENFADKRYGGAKKITDNAKEKGGVSMLTYHHFKVKLPYYEKASNGKFDIEDAKKEYNELLKKLYSGTKNDMDIEQVAFQELVGKIEVLGELIIKNKK